MLIPIPTPFRKRYRPAKRKGSTIMPAPTGPVLVAASTFFSHGSAVILTFDRAIDISGLVGGAIVVDDPITTGKHYLAIGPATLDTPNVLRVVLYGDGSSTGTVETLVAGAPNGIVAVEDGVAWSGVGETALPFT